MSTKSHSKRGRPRRTRNLASNFISLRVTPHEKAIITRGAHRANKPLPSWARETLLAAAGNGDGGIDEIILEEKPWRWQAAEKETISRAARRAHKPLKTWAREALLAAANSPEPSDNPEYRMDIRKTGDLNPKERKASVS